MPTHQPPSGQALPDQLMQQGIKTSGVWLGSWLILVRAGETDTFWRKASTYMFCENVVVLLKFMTQVSILKMIFLFSLRRPGYMMIFKEM